MALVFRVTSSFPFSLPELSEEPVRGQGVLSDINYGSFRAWLNSDRGQAELQLGQDSSIISKVVLIVHQDASEGAFLESHAVRSPYRVAACTAVGCERCTTQKGGFQFPYVSSLWTPLLAFHNELTIGRTPNACRHICNSLSFPLGLRRGPDYFARAKRQRIQDVRDVLSDPILGEYVNDVSDADLEELDAIVLEYHTREVGP